MRVIRIRAVGHEQKQVRQRRLFQCGAECADQLVRELADKADGVGEQESRVRPDLYAAHGGVQCGKNHVFGKNFPPAGRGGAASFLPGRGGTAGEQCVHQSGFSGICIADQRHAADVFGQTLGALRRPLAADALQLPFQFGNPVFDVPAVQLELLFAGALIGQAPAAAALAGEADAQSGESRQHIFQTCTFYLQTRLARSGAAGENLQNNACAVQHFRVPCFFQVADLHGRE